MSAEELLGHKTIISFIMRNQGDNYNYAINKKREEETRGQDNQVYDIPIISI